MAKKWFLKKAQYCKSCASTVLQPTKIDWTSVKDLIQMVSESSYLAVSKQLGVSDNAVKKRIRNHSRTIEMERDLPKDNFWEWI